VWSKQRRKRGALPILSQQTTKGGDSWTREKIGVDTPSVQKHCSNQKERTGGPFDHKVRKKRGGVFGLARKESWATAVAKGALSKRTGKREKKTCTLAWSKHGRNAKGRRLSVYSNVKQKQKPPWNELESRQQKPPKRKQTPTPAKIGSIVTRGEKRREAREKRKGFSLSNRSWRGETGEEGKGSAR